jgi:hypothetical protein
MDIKSKLGRNSTVLGLGILVYVGTTYVQVEHEILTSFVYDLFNGTH